MKTAWAIVVAVLVGSQLVAAEEKVCSSFCSSLGTLQSSPGQSCNDIYQINKASRGVSGLYWITATDGAKQVYCDMELECGGHKGGWMRIADLDTSRGDDCPVGWTRTTAPGIGVCRTPNTDRGCYSAMYSVNGVKYSKICGRVKGYQKGQPDGFLTSTPGTPSSINTYYVDGISITIGSPRKHVWTYAEGFSDDGNFPHNNCPCADTAGPPPPSFVQNHYYCESGTTGMPSQGSYYTSDPLWDGEGCVGANNNCCTTPGMPWFYRAFPTSQQDDAEVRICAEEDFLNESAVVEVVQLFVQ